MNRGDYIGYVLFCQQLERTFFKEIKFFENVPSMFYFIIFFRIFAGEEKSAQVRSLQLQKGILFFDAARITRQTPVGTYDAVTRNDQRDGIVTDGSAHSLCGYVLPGPGGELFCDLPVSSGRSIRDLQQNFPYVPAEL